MNKEQLDILGQAVNARPDVVALWLPYFQQYLPSNGINTPERLIAFLAQTAQESGNWYYTEEIGEATCPGYQGGCKYKGRGLIGLTHLDNYERFKSRYGVDVVKNPSLVGGKYSTTSTPEQLKNSLLSGTFFWETGRLNDLADKLDLTKSVYSEPNNSYFKCIGRKINRGIHTDCTKAANGESVRLDKFEKLRLAYMANRNKFASVSKSRNKWVIPIVITTSVVFVVGAVLIIRHVSKNK